MSFSPRRRKVERAGFPEGEPGEIFDKRIWTGNTSKAREKKEPWPGIDIQKGVNFMVKLLRACVWMPWRQEAKKDVASCEKPRGDASNL